MNKYRKNTSIVMVYLATVVAVYNVLTHGLISMFPVFAFAIGVNYIIRNFYAGLLATKIWWVALALFIVGYIFAYWLVQHAVIVAKVDTVLIGIFWIVFSLYLIHKTKDQR